MMTTFDALAEPMRRRILDLLREQPRFVGELGELLDISQPGISKHLRVLREVGLVRVRQDAQRRWYELRPEPLAEIDAWRTRTRPTSRSTRKCFEMPGWLMSSSSPSSPTKRGCSRSKSRIRLRIGSANASKVGIIE